MRVDEQVPVLVVDSGIDARHPWFEGASLEQRDFTGEGREEDSIGHGTFHAGQVWRAAGPGCRLLVARVVGTTDEATPEAVVRALAWGRAEGARVVSIGLGAEASTPELDEAVRGASTWAVVIAPVGNHLGVEHGVAAALYPARLPEVLGVGRRGREGRAGSTACLGLDALAEGEAVGPSPGGGQVRQVGTSVAAALLAGEVTRLLAGASGLREAAREGRGRQALLEALGPGAQPPGNG